MTVSASGPVVEIRERHQLRQLGSALLHGRGRVGLLATIAVALVASAGPMLSPHDPLDPLMVPFAPASMTFPLGGDYLGRDMLSRLLSGGWSVIWMSAAATITGFIVGLALGMLAAYSRAAVDELIMRMLEVVQGFPQIVLVLLFVSIVGPNDLLVVLTVALAWVPNVARLTRGATLSIVRNDWVQAAELAGSPKHVILVREIAPNLVGPLAVDFGQRLAWSVSVLTAVSFLGFGVQPPTPDWGRMINENRIGLVSNPLSVIAPVAAISTYAIGVNLMADSIARSIARIDVRKD